MKKSEECYFSAIFFSHCCFAMSLFMMNLQPSNKYFKTLNCSVWENNVVYLNVRFFLCLFS